jgi:Domain of unknown function (DUF4266)
MEADSGWRMADGTQAARTRLAVSSPSTSSPLPLRERARVRGCASALLALAAITLSGCGNIEPWVKPYERQQLADPIMSFDPHPVSTSYMHHVFEAREGARGALGSGGGGCGCN